MRARLVKESLKLRENEEEVFKGQIETGLTFNDIDKKEFLIGLAIEKKAHSSNLAVQKTLVIQNLAKDPKYYSKMIKKGLVDDIEALNLYKKYFIDMKDNMEESLTESLKDEIIDTLLQTVYKGEDPIETRKYLESFSTEALDTQLGNYYLFDLKRKDRK